MKTYLPTMYKKSVFEIPYAKLKNRGIKCLVFDLDNTLALIEEHKCPKRTKELIEKLQKDFTVIIISNNNRKRIQPFLDELKIDGVALALKPFTRGLRKIKNKYGFLKSEMVMIGDQLLTDIKSGNKFKIMTILVDPLGEKDLMVTKLNRYREKKIRTKIGLKKGAYYE